MDIRTLYEQRLTPSVIDDTDPDNVYLGYLLNGNPNKSAIIRLMKCGQITRRLYAYGLFEYLFSWTDKASITDWRFRDFPAGTGMNSCPAAILPGIVYPSSILLVDGSLLARLFVYNPSIKSCTELAYNNPLGVSVDIAHTQNKMWLCGGSYEWNITLNPFSAIYNRQISNMPGSSPGLAAKDDHTVIQMTGTGVYEVNVTNDVATYTLKFTTIPGRTVAGDFILTTGNKFLVTTFNGGTRYLTQYNYLTGAVEVDINISGFDGMGMFQYNNEIFITSANNIYKVNKTAPYALTLYDTLPGLASIYGASQLPENNTANLIP